MILKSFAGAAIALCLVVSSSSAVTFFPRNEMFQQLPNGDLKVSGTFLQTNRLAEDYDLKIKLTIYEDDFPIPFGSGHDLLGMFMFSLWIDEDPTVLPMVKDVSPNGMATAVQVLGLQVNYMFTIPNGVALGGGAGDNDYFSEGDVTRVTSPVPLPSSVFLSAVGLGVLGAARWARRKPTKLSLSAA